MKIYANGAAAYDSEHRMCTQPGKEHPETSAFMGADGTPLLMWVTFKNGVAEVPDELGNYMVAKGHARATKLILPPGAIARGDHTISHRTIGVPRSEAGA